MDIGQAVRIIKASPEFYAQVTFNGPDPFELGCQGVVQSFAMNDYIEPGWMVKLHTGKTSFFYEEELESIERVEGPEKPRARRIPEPWWYNDITELRSRLFNVQVLGHEFSDEFIDDEGHGPWFHNEEHVEDKIERLERGEE